MPNVRTETYGVGDQSWLASDHGLFNARTSVITVANFTKATHYPNGYIPSGLPVNAAAEGDIKPFTGAAGEVLGFVLTDQPVGPDAHVNAPILRHGLVKTHRLPVAFDVPTAGAEAFTFITEENA